MMTTQRPEWPTPVFSRGGAARPIAPASGTLLAVLILLAVLPSAAAVSSAGVDAASWSTLAEAPPASRNDERPGAESSSGVPSLAVDTRRSSMPIVRAVASCDRVERLSWGEGMASRGLGAIPPPSV